MAYQWLSFIHVLNICFWSQLLTMFLFFSGAVRLNACTSHATDYDIENTIKNWFRFCKDRDGGRESCRMSQENGNGK